MSGNNEIKFNLQDCNGNANLNAEGKIEYGQNCDDKLKKLDPIFNAIAKLGGEEGKIDTAEERNLLRKLQSVFKADGDTTISENELAMLDEFESGADVKKFINDKVVEKNVTPEGLEDETAQSSQVSIDRRTAYNMEITKKRTQDLKDKAKAFDDT